MLGLQKINGRTKTLAGFFLTVFLLLIAIIFTPDAQVHQTYASSPSRTKQAQGQTASGKKPQHSVSNIPATGEQTGALSGIASWAGQQSTNAVDVLAVNTTTGSQQDVNPDRFGNGSYSMDLPVGTYDVTAEVLGYARGVPDTVITQQTVSITALTTTTLNVDYSTVTGLVQGDLSANGTSSGGTIGNGWPFYSPGFALAIPTGTYTLSAFDTNENPTTSATVTMTNEQISGPIHLTLSTGTLAGIASWAGQQSTNAIDVLAVNTAKGFQQDVNPDRFGNGSYSMDLPVGAYNVTAKVLGYAQGVPDTVITQQAVSIRAQTTTTLNFDYSTVTGLVTGDLIVNDMQSGGSVGNNWPFHPPGFALAIPPGGASIPVFDTNYNLAGQANVTVTNGAQVLLDSASDSVPSGGNVSAPLGNLTLTFSRVTHTGKASAIATNSLQGGAAPPSFTFQGNFYNVSTSASSIEHYTVAIRYTGMAAVKAAATSQTPPQLLQWNGSNWLNITTFLDTTNQVITGVASSLSTFVIATSTDTTPPTTTITPSGKLGNNNWYQSNVSITLTAADNSGGTGVASTQYNLNNGKWLLYKGPIKISHDGTTLVMARSIDMAGNIETPVQLTLNVDRLKPALSNVGLSSSYIQNGTPVTISANASDAISGVAAVTYTLNDGTTGLKKGSGSLIFDSTSDAWQAVISPPTGFYAVTLTAIDAAGNSQLSTPLYLAVFDPNAGSVNGSGSYTPLNTTLVGFTAGGVATMNFSGQYPSGSTTPQGNLSFSYAQDGFTFTETSLTWLAINGTSADFQGQGQVNGAGSYTFQVHIVADSPGQFDIRIWTTGNSFTNPNFRAGNSLSNGTITIQPGPMSIHTSISPLV